MIIKLLKTFLANKLKVLLVLTLVLVSFTLFTRNPSPSSIVSTKTDHNLEGYKNWQTYTNYRFGYTVNYPQDWPEGEESDNGDGKSLYIVGMDEISVSSTLNPSSWLEYNGLIEQKGIVLSDGRKATQIKFKDREEGRFIYVVFFDDKGKQYTFFAKVSAEFFNENEQLLQQVAKSFKRIKGEEDISQDCTDDELQINSLNNDVKNNPKAMQLIREDCLWAHDSKSIDLTGDGKSELVLNTVGWGCASCHSKDVYILEGDQIIFSKHGDGLTVEELPNSQTGFNLNEPIRVDDEALCCPSNWTVYTYLYSLDNTNHGYFKLTNTTTEKYQVEECDNYTEITKFKEPIPVVWDAKFTGCLSGCWGAAFTRVPNDSKYPRFSGYVPDSGNRIADEFMKEGQILKIYGKWIDVSDSYGSVFDNKCVPTVDIEKIEIVK